MFKKCTDPAKELIFVAEVRKPEPLSPSNRKRKKEDKDQEDVGSVVDTSKGCNGIVGCIHIEVLHSGKRVGAAGIDGSATSVDATASSSSEDDAPAELGMFAVDPDFQSKGVGSRLIKAAHTHIVDVMKCKASCIWVFNIRKDIQTWYQKLGYKLTGEQAPFPNSGGVGEKVLVDGAIFLGMRKQLVES